MHANQNGRRKGAAALGVLAVLATSAFAVPAAVATTDLADPAPLSAATVNLQEQTAAEDAQSPDGSQRTIDPNTTGKNESEGSGEQAPAAPETSVSGESTEASENPELLSPSEEAPGVRSLLQEFSATQPSVSETLTAEEASQAVSIPDAALRAAVNEALGQTADSQVTQEQALTVTKIQAYEAGIVSLEGLQEFANLEILLVGANSISDLSPLSGLKSLKTLDVYANQITSVEPLRASTGLDALSVYYNEGLSDITPLFDLPQLTYLDLALTAATDLSGIEKLDQLTYLDLYGVPIVDPSPIAKLKKLEFLSVWETGIKDANFVSGLTSLTDLSIADNAITDLKPVSGLTNLSILSTQGNPITDVSPLSGLVNLVELNLWGNQISDISPLSAMTELEEIVLSFNSVSDLSPLSNLQNLKGLYLPGNEIVDIEPLAGLNNLERLSLFNNAVEDITALSDVPNLTTLFIGGNRISNVSPLQGLTKLNEIGLSGNRISDVSPLAEMTALTELDLDSNEVVDLSPLAKLSTLTGLSAEGQNINLPSILVGATYTNPVRDLQGKSVAVASTSEGFTSQAQDAGWGFSAAGDKTLSWETTATLAGMSASFSGTFTQLAYEDGDTPSRQLVLLAPLGGHYHTGNKVVLRATAEPAAENAKYVWYLQRADQSAPLVIEGANEASTELVAEAALDGAKVYVELQDPNGTVLATSATRTVVVDDHGHGPARSLSIEGLAKEYTVGQALKLTATPGSATVVNKFEWFMIPADGGAEVKLGAGKELTVPATLEMNGASVYATLVLDNGGVYAKSDAVQLKVVAADPGGDDDNTGGSQSDDSQSGGSQSGGSKPDESQSGDSQSGGSQSGESQSGGSQSGGPSAPDQSGKADSNGPKSDALAKTGAEVKAMLALGAFLVVGGAAGVAVSRRLRLQ